MSLKSRVFKASAEIIDVTPTANTFHGTGTSVIHPKCTCDKLNCICIGRYDSTGKLTYYGPPIETVYKPTSNLPVVIPDENLLMDAFNRAVAKHPKDFVELIDTGSIYYKQCKHVIFELGLMGYCIMENPFE